jgi:hypothetical protein
VSERFVALEGGPADLNFLLGETWTPDIWIDRIDGAVYLHAPSLATSANVEAAFAEGERLVRWLNGGASILNRRHTPVILAAVCELVADGTIRRHATFRPIGFQMNVAIGQLTLGIDGVTHAVPASTSRLTIAEWVETASGEPAAALALEFVTEVAGRWAELYRIVESVQKAAGSKLEKAIGAALSERLDQFTQSANYAHPGQRHKRHPPQPSKRGAVPKNPDMSIAEGEQYMRYVVSAYLNWKAAGN